MNDKNEFYVGWQATAPDGLARTMRKTIIFLFILMLIAAAVLAWKQKKFSTAVFEFGKLTQVTGLYRPFPVPSIEMTTQRDAFGKASYITMPLIGYGKFGAEGLIAELEKAAHTSFDNKLIRLNCTLLYSDGRTFLQIDGSEKPLVAIGETVPLEASRPELKDLGTVTLKGEIVDPKCYFGVMKPGYGKVHRDCAIRCIEGGMPPVFHTVDSCGGSSYYLILDANGKKMNGVLKDYIADPVALEAKAVQYNDWVILYLKGKESIHRIGGLSLVKPDDAETLSCGPAH